MPLGESGVEVLHFFELCSKILGQEIAYEKKDSEYYDLIISETVSKIPGSNLKNDAILVDEGQDFSDDMCKVVASLLNEKTNNLTIAQDEGPKLQEGGAGIFCRRALKNRVNYFKEYGYEFHLTYQQVFLTLKREGPLTQEVEYLPFKQRVAGSSPVRPTTVNNQIPSTNNQIMTNFRMAKSQNRIL